MQATVPVAHWYWKDETGKWLAYDAANSQAIELSFQSQRNEALIIGGRYVVNLPARKQINLGSHFTRDVRRGTWFWVENGNTAYIPYSEHIATTLEASWNAGHFNNFKIDVGEGRYVILRADGSSRQYRAAGARNPVGRAVLRGYNNQVASAGATVVQTQVIQQAPAVQTVVQSQVPQMIQQTVVQDQIPQGQMIQGQVVYPQQTVVQGQDQLMQYQQAMLQGQMMQQQIPQGQMMQQQIPQGQMMQQQIPQGQMMQQMPQGQMMQQMPQGQMMQQMPQGQMMQQMPQGQMMQQQGQVPASGYPPGYDNSNIIATNYGNQGYAQQMQGNNMYAQY